MLVLTRRVGEAIVIDSDIRVSVLAVKGRQVRLGIAAPDSIRIVRTEILECCPPRAGREEPEKSYQT